MARLAKESQSNEGSRMTQTKLTKEQIGKLKQAGIGITFGFSWIETDEGYSYWHEVVQSLDAKIKHGTIDGKPYVDPEPPIPEGWRRAEADEWTRKDVKYWDLYEKDWRPRLSQGTAFDPSGSNTHYIVPIDPPLTDEDACVWPRLLVMVRDHESKPWLGPYCYQGKSDGSAFPFIADSGLDVDRVWKQARRATPEEIEAAK